MVKKRSLKTIGLPNHEIWSDGTVYSYKVKRKLNVHLNGSGYPYIRIKHNYVWHNLVIHRVLAKIFIPNPENKPCINHIDGVKTNNDLSNLEWVTHKENSKHAVELGLSVYDKTRAINQSKAKGYIPTPLKHPTYGMEVMVTLSSFARKYKLHTTHLSKLLDGRLKTHGGWSLV